MSVLQDENIRKILKPIGIVFSLFQILIVLQPMEAMSLRSIHLGFVMVMVFLLHGILKNPSRTTMGRAVMIVLALLGAAACFYIYMNGYELTTDRQGMFNDADLFFGGLLTVVLLAATWIVYGVPITTLMFVALIYLFFWSASAGRFGTSRGSLRTCDQQFKSFHRRDFWLRFSSVGDSHCGIHYIRSLCSGIRRRRVVHGPFHCRFWPIQGGGRQGGGFWQYTVWHDLRQRGCQLRRCGHDHHSFDETVRFSAGSCRCD